MREQVDLGRGDQTGNQNPTGHDERPVAADQGHSNVHSHGDDQRGVSRGRTKCPFFTGPDAPDVCPGNGTGHDRRNDFDDGHVKNVVPGEL